MSESVSDRLAHLSDRIDAAAGAWQGDVVLRFRRDTEATFICTDTVTDQYGTGATPVDALADYLATLAEYIIILDRQAGMSRQPGLRARTCRRLLAALRPSGS